LNVSYNTLILGKVPFFLDVQTSVFLAGRVLIRNTHTKPL